MIDKKSLGQKGEDIACKALEKDASINGVASQLLTFIFSLCQMLRPDPDLLTVVAGSAFKAGGGLPASVAVDPSGKFVYVANNCENTVSAFTINASTGALTPVDGSPFAAGNGPSSVATTGTSQ